MCFFFRKLNDPYELKYYLDSIYSEAAQYNKPLNYPVTIICGGIDGAPKESDILDKIQLESLHLGEICLVITQNPSLMRQIWDGDGK